MLDNRFVRYSSVLGIIYTTPNTLLYLTHSLTKYLIISRTLEYSQEFIIN